MLQISVLSLKKEKIFVLLVNKKLNSLIVYTILSKERDVDRFTSVLSQSSEETES